MNIVGVERRPSDNDDVVQLRSMVLKKLGTSGDENVLLWAKKKFSSQGTEISKDYKREIFEILCVNDDAIGTHLKKYHEVMRASNSIEEQVITEDGLMHCSDIEDLIRFTEDNLIDMNKPRAFTFNFLKRLTYFRQKLA